MTAVRKRPMTKTTKRGSSDSGQAHLNKWHRHASRNTIHVLLEVLIYPLKHEEELAVAVVNILEPGSARQE